MLFKLSRSEKRPIATATSSAVPSMPAAARDAAVAASAGEMLHALRRHVTDAPALVSALLMSAAAAPVSVGGFRSSAAAMPKGEEDFLGELPSWKTRPLPAGKHDINISCHVWSADLMTLDVTWILINASHSARLAMPFQTFGLILQSVDPCK
jgi:hypothetical protein